MQSTTQAKIKRIVKKDIHPMHKAFLIAKLCQSETFENAVSFDELCTIISRDCFNSENHYMGSGILDKLHCEGLVELYQCCKPYEWHIYDYIKVTDSTFTKFDKTGKYIG